VVVVLVIQVDLWIRHAHMNSTGVIGRHRYLKRPVVLTSWAVSGTYRLAFLLPGARLRAAGGLA
jgi:hypothetical protein